MYYGSFWHYPVSAWSIIHQVNNGFDNPLYLYNLDFIIGISLSSKSKSKMSIIFCCIQLFKNVKAEQIEKLKWHGELLGLVWFLGLDLSPLVQCFVSMTPGPVD